MQNLLNELTNGTKEYDSDGNMLVKPPTALMLKAARVLKQVAEINLANQDIMNRLQLRVNEQLNELTQLRENYDKLSNPSVREDSGQISGVEGGDGRHSTSDTDSERSGEAPEGSSSSSSST